MSENNTDIDEDWVKAQQPGWHHKRRTNFGLLAGMPVEDLVRDGWTEAFRDIFGGMRQYRLVAGVCSRGAWVGRFQALIKRGLKHT